MRDAWRGWLGADFVSRDTEGRRVHGLVTALALRMRDLGPELLVLREQVDPLAERARGYITGAGLSGRVAVGIDVGRGDRTTVVVAELRPDGTCRVLDVSTREAP
jgi:hypothetical protein